MQTSTPSDTGGRSRSKNVSDLNISPGSATGNEAGTKVYSRRERKPRKWDDFETESSSEPQQKRKPRRRLSVCDVGENCETEENAIEILIEEQKTLISVANISPIQIEVGSTGRKSKGKAKSQKKNVSVTETDINVNRGSSAENAIKKKKRPVSVKKVKIFEEQLPQSKRNKTEGAQGGNSASKIDKSVELDERLAADLEELEKLRKAVESRRTTKYIDKNERVMDIGNDCEQRNDDRQTAGKELLSNMSVKAEPNDEIPRKFKKKISSKMKNDKDVSINKSKTGNRRSAKKLAVKEHDSPPETSVNSEKVSIETNVHVDENVSISDEYKTPNRKRKRQTVKEEKQSSPQNHKLEETPLCKTTSRKGAKTKSSLDVETNDNGVTKVSNGPGRRGRKRKEINYADLDNGDLEYEADDKSSSRKPKKEIVSKKQIDKSQEFTDDSAHIEKSERKKEISKKALCYKCHHCDYEGRGKPNIQSHYALEHQLWWKEDCPEGSSKRIDLIKVIKIKKFLNCPTCGKQINFITYYPNHLEWCGREHLTYTCTYCKKANLVLRWQTIHLKTCPGLMYLHSLERKKKREEEGQQDSDSDAETPGKVKRRKAAKKALTMVHDISKDMEPSTQSDQSDKDPDAEIPDENDVNDDDSDDSDDDLGVAEEEIDTPVEDDDGEDIVDFDEEDEGRTSATSLRLVYSFNPHPEMEEFVKKYWSLDLFSDWLPWKQDWQQLSLQETEECLPKQRSSMRFCYGKRSIPTSLELFQSTHIDGSPLFYTGLSVWKLAWCPMSLECTDSQYLAVTGKRDHSQSFFTDKRCEESCIIQIWNTGICSNNPLTTALPKLSFNIVHDYGQATQIVWCPSGCYKSNQNQTEAGVYLRLGLLAVSSTDGACRIFSIPLLPDTSNPPALRARPVLTLIPHYKYTQHEITCSCVDWVKASGHTKVLTGYSNGTVKVFNLLTKSPLQYLETKDGPKLLPYINLQPHGNLVRAVCFCSTLDSVIITSSEDFETCFFDLNSLGSSMHNDGGFYMTTCMTCSVFQHGVYIGCDDNYAYISNKGRYVESSHLIYMGKPDEYRKEDRAPYYISSQPACIWDISCSDWIGILATSDNRGYICGLLVKDLMTTWPDCKSYKYRQVFLRTKVREDSCVGEEEKEEKTEIQDRNVSKQCVCGASDSGGSDSKNGQTETSVDSSCNTPDKLVTCECKSSGDQPVNEPRSAGTTEVRNTGSKKDYQTLASDCVLQFEEYLKVAEFCPYDTESDKYDKASVAAIKSLSFNPNHHQCCWLAYGGNSGLVRLVNVKNMLSHKTSAYMRVNKKF